MTDSRKEGISIKHSRYVETNLKPYLKILTQIHTWDFHFWSTDQIRERLDFLRKQVRQLQFSQSDDSGQRKLLDQFLPESYALVGETVHRLFGWTVFDCQYLGAVAMHQGRVIELDTGEGKTLVAVFVACLHALTGRGVHILTFNDYLAKRDAEWMKPIYDALGFSAAFVQQDMTAEPRKAAYNCDITYLTAKEAGFDYLRGFLATAADDLVQRPFYLAIVDEADSTLIDEARIPLVIASDISGPGSIDPLLYRLVSRMRSGLHYHLDTFGEHLLITEAGAIWLEQRLGIANLYDSDQVERLTQIRLILQAHTLLKRDVDYIVRDDRIELVDEFTGRVIQNRQWPEGLHEAVEIKEGLQSHTQGSILNQITLRDFLSLYSQLCGMTGTAWSAAPEFHAFYQLRVTRIPPHIPCRRIDQPDYVFNTKLEKEAAILQEIIRRHEAGQPVLVGTASVEESERLAGIVKKRGLPCDVLNARHDETEAAMIARAGETGAITISTNMAGRGVDIRLGEKVTAGLFILGTNRHRSIRIDRQLRGRAGRQGDPGESRFFISLEDDLIERYQIRSVLPAAWQTQTVISSPSIQASGSTVNSTAGTSPVRDISHSVVSEPPATELEHKPAVSITPDLAPKPIDDPQVTEAVDHTQRVIEGQLYQQRLNLTRYTVLVEEQRAMIHQLHLDLITGRKKLEIWQQSRPDQVQALMAATSAEQLQQAEQQAGALLLNQGWADYLSAVEQLLGHVSSMMTGPNDPWITFQKQIIDVYTHLLDTFESDMLALLDRLKVQGGQIDLAEAGVKRPPMTHTYLIEDGSDSLDQLRDIGTLVAAAMNPALFGLVILAKWRRRRQESKD